VRWKAFEAFVSDRLALERESRVLEFPGGLPIEVRAPRAGVEGSRIIH
jgi:hypothetical protein